MPRVDTAPITIERSGQYEKNVYIFSLRDDEYRLSVPIPVHLEYENNIFVAVSHDLNLFGLGDVEEEAITDLCHEIVDYYLDLEAEHQNVTDQMKQHWQFLQRVIEPCR